MEFMDRHNPMPTEKNAIDLALCTAVFKRSLPENHTATWRAVFQGADTAVPPSSASGAEACLTLAQGLPAGPHVLELRGNDLAEQIQAIRFYCPQGGSGKTGISK
jgi:hypothetical protein